MSRISVTGSMVRTNKSGERGSSWRRPYSYVEDLRDRINDEDEQELAEGVLLAESRRPRPCMKGRPAIPSTRDDDMKMNNAAIQF
jgi:hypothetical protein